MSWFSTTIHNGSAICSINGEVGDGRSAEEFARSIGDAPRVELFINSPGGDSHTALKAFDVLAARHTTATITGHCGSAACTMALAAQRIIHASKWPILIHAPAAFFYGTAAEIPWQLERLQNNQQRHIEVYSRRTKQPAEVVAGWFSRDTYFSPEEALASGLVDEIATVPPAPVETSRQAPAAASAPGPAMSESEAAFRHWLEIFPPIQTADPAALARAVSEFLTCKVKSLA